MAPEQRRVSVDPVLPTEQHRQDGDQHAHHRVLRPQFPSDVQAGQTETHPGGDGVGQKHREHVACDHRYAEAAPVTIHRPSG